jgi:hypothetical protein
VMSSKKNKLFFVSRITYHVSRPKE